MIRIELVPLVRIRQGDVFRDVEYVEHVSEQAGTLEISKIVFPLVMVLTQDCDLEQDHRFRWSEETRSNQDKWLLSVLVAPLYNVEHVIRGEHLSELNMKMGEINWKRTEGRYLRNNQLPRFHYLEFPDFVSIVPSVIDFKHYFSVNVGYLQSIRDTNFVCSVGSLFREQVSQRFGSFLARIGLPDAREE